jgi:tetratricopeptide (TPR) repeat protein
MPFVRTIRPTALLMLAAIPLLSLACESTPTRVLQERADRDFEYKRFDAAAATYAEIVKREPHKSEVLYHYGVSLLKTDKPSQAEGALRTALALDPGNDAIVAALAESLDMQGEYAKLFALLRDRANDIRSVESWMLVVDYAQKLNDHDSALEAITNACALDSGNDVRPYYRAAIILGGIGRTEDAVRRLRQAYGIDPSNQDVTTLLVEYGEIPGPTLGLAPGA